MTWSVADTAQTLTARFEEQARLHPDRPAIGGTSWTPSYAELDAAANGIASSLLDCGLRNGDRVALLLGHDAPLFAAAIGALKAGATIVVQNPADPSARLGQVRADFEPDLVLIDPPRRELAGAAGYREDQILEVAERPGGSAVGPPPRSLPDDPAFLIYTSGSTGRPKGVVQTHRNMLHNVLRHTSGLGISAEDRIVLLASPSGGQGVGTTWTALLNGATLCPFALAERGVTGLADWLQEHRVTVFVSPASVLRGLTSALGDRVVPGVRLVRLGSEPAFRSDFEAFRRHFPDAKVLVNTFSSSEAGSIARCAFARDALPPPGRLTAGRAAEGVEVRLLDPGGAEVATGEVGEITVRSRYLSPGYWRDQERTAERYATTDDGSRTFRTGDLGRRSDDGLLTVVGRDDDQVKVRGHRVELSEVELALLDQPEVAAAGVLAAGGDRLTLTAYVVPAADTRPTARELRTRLRAVLPSPAVPSAFAFVDEIPLTGHGKVDRTALALIEPAEHGNGPVSAPSRESDDLLAALFAEALERKEVGRDQGFLELGGDSLSAAVVAAGVLDIFGVDVGLATFADDVTVRELTRTVESLRDREASGDTPALVRTDRTSPAPMSFAQERAWLSARTAAGRLGHNMAVPVRIRGPLDRRALTDALAHVVGRHEALRTTLGERDGHPVQVVHPSAPPGLPFHDLRLQPGAERRARRLLARDARRPFDLERGPLLRLRLVRLSRHEHWLLRVNHHAISDGWSWGLFFDELAACYEARVAGKPFPLPADQPFGYGDFAAWQRRLLEPGSPRLRRELSWWREVFAPEHEPLTLPPSRVAPPDGPVAPGIHRWGMEPGLSQRLDHLGRGARATALMVRLALFSAQLAVETDREDIVLGMYVTNRKLAETQEMFGDFTNLVTLRLRFTGDPGFRDWLEQVRGAVVAASEHVDVPYARVCEELSAEGIEAPEIRAVFGRVHGVRPTTCAGLDLRPLPAPLQLEPTGFTFTFDHLYEADRNYVYFDSASYEPGAVADFVERYRALADAVCRDPSTGLRALATAPEPSLSSR